MRKNIITKHGVMQMSMFRILFDHFVFWKIVYCKLCLEQILGCATQLIILVVIVVC